MVSRQSVLGQDRSEAKQIGLRLGLDLVHYGLGLGLGNHNDLEGRSNVSSTIL